MTLDKGFESRSTFTTNTTAYTTGDVLGGPLTFDMKKSLGNGLINGAIATDNDTKGVQGDLYLFNVPPTAIADNAVFTGVLVLADWLARQTKISFATYDTDGIFKSCQVPDINDLFVSLDGNLYGYFVITGAAPTFANGKKFDIKLMVSSQ